MDLAHPNSDPKIRALENEIADKKAALAILIAEQEPKAIEDYIFLDSNNKEVLLSQLFGGSDELVIVFYMGYQCKYCTLWADGYNGLFEHLNNRSGFAVVSHETPLFQQELCKERGWKFPMYSRMQNAFAEDLGFTSKEEDNKPLPGIAAFLKKEGKVYLHHQSYFGPGDNFCIQWDILNILPKGLNNWKPEYYYGGE